MIILFLSLSLFIKISKSTILDLAQCDTPLGMHSGLIRDEDITASSSFDGGNVGPQHGRVNVDKNGGAWCPLSPAEISPNEFLEIDLKTVHVVTGVGTQGRFGAGRGVEYAEYYVLEYWRPALGRWVRYHDHKSEEVFLGNTNTYQLVTRILAPPLYASKLRIYPLNKHGSRTVCMRVEIFGCRQTSGIVTYSAPQGYHTQFTEENTVADKVTSRSTRNRLGRDELLERRLRWDFTDSTYDGTVHPTLSTYPPIRYLHSGLGKLVDGRFGEDDFRVGFRIEDQKWFGWRRRSEKSTNETAVELRFEFDRVREFSALKVHCNNMFSKEVQVFATAKIFFSLTGKKYNTEKVINFEYIPDKIFEESRIVKINLSQRIGRFVKIQLSFASKWLLISEIGFDSRIVRFERKFLEQENAIFKKNEEYLKIITWVIIILIISIVFLVIFISVIIKKYFKIENMDVKPVAEVVYAFPLPPPPLEDFCEQHEYQEPVFSNLDSYQNSFKTFYYDENCEYSVPQE